MSAIAVRCPHCDIGYPADEVEGHIERCPVTLSAERIQEFYDYMEHFERRLRIMGLVKHGVGEVLPDADTQKTAAKGEWTDKDEQELAQESADDDKE